MSVIVSRALPDVRDGLKPVHRRILWDMETQGFRPDRPFVKCARVTGDTMAKYHPHGNSAIYDALVRMAQPFSLRHPLIDFHGNYGSADDGAAAERYTECRLHPLAMRLLAGIDEDTVDFTPELRRHHPGAGRPAGPVPEPAGQRQPGHRGGHGHQHPAAQPGRGHRRHRPPHRPPRRHPRRPHAVRQGPRLPDRRAASSAGPASWTPTARAGAPSRCGPRPRSRRPASAATASRSWSPSCRTRCRRTPCSVASRTSSTPATSMASPTPTTPRPAWTRALVIDLKRDANPNVVLNNLFKLTQLQTSFPVNMVALVDGVPRTLNLVDALAAYIGHQVEVITRRSEFRLDKARKRAHIARRPAPGPRHDRRHHRPHPGERRPGHGPRRADGGAVLVQRGAGQLHPRHAPRAAHPAVAPGARGRAGRAAPDHRRARGASWPTKAASSR